MSYLHSNVNHLPEFVQADLAWQNAVRGLERLSLGDIGLAFFEDLARVIPGAKYATKSHLVIETQGSPVYLQFVRMAGKIAIVLERPPFCGWGEPDWFRLNFLTANGYVTPDVKGYLLAMAHQAVSEWRGSSK